MFSIVYSLIARFKALFVTYAVLNLEADLIAACAERKAELLRRATQYEQEGLPTVAGQLRQQAEALSVDKPLGSVLTTVAHLKADQAEPARPAEATDRGLHGPAAPNTGHSQPSSKKKPQIVIDFSHALARHARAVFGPLEKARMKRSARRGPLSKSSACVTLS